MTRTSGGALRADGIFVQGAAYLGDGFLAKGIVGLVGAQVGHALDFEGGTFDQVNAQRAAVKGSLFWRKINQAEKTSLNLSDASAASLVDDRESWPSSLAVDGFVYGRIAAGPRDSQSRLEWLRRQEVFAPQPYRQLAKVLRDEGDEGGARRVLYEMERRKHHLGEHRWSARFWNLIFRGTIGYGIYPRRALWWLLLLLVLGWGAYRRGYFAGAITPTNKDAYSEFHRQHEPPEYYQHFYASVYSAENCFPLVKLGQAEFWTPDPSQRGVASILRWFRWLQVVLGWTLATFFVVGVTGLARKD